MGQATSTPQANISHSASVIKSKGGDKRRGASQNRNPKPLPRPSDLKLKEAGTGIDIRNNGLEGKDFMSNTLSNGILFHERRLFDVSAYYFSIAASKGLLPSLSSLSI